MNPSPSEPWISVVIVCHDDGRWLPRCLESIRAQTLGARIEVIVADNASQDGSDQLAQDLLAGWANARFLQTGGDWGFGVAHNRASELARGKYLYLLSPDTWLEPDCLERLYETCEREQAAGAGALVLNYDDETVQARGSHGYDFCGQLVVPRRGRPLRRLFCISNFNFIRRDVFVRLGRFDEAFFLYSEEADLAWRLWIAGERLVPALDARLHHRGAVGVNPAGGTKVLENRTSAQKRFLANRNVLLVIAKNGQHLLLLLLVPSMVLILLEGLATWVMTRRGSVAYAGSLAALADFWRLRGHVREQRRRIRALRRHGDFWMLRFFRLGFGRSGEVRDILQRGFPKFR